MKLKNNPSQKITGIVFLLLLYAYFAREWAYEVDNLFGKTALQLTRHLIHTGLILGWMISVNRRILQRHVRHCLLAIGGLLAFWLYIRTLKWMFFPDLSWQSRYLWYGYYIPLILVPLLGIFVVQYLGKREEYTLSWKRRFLYFPAFLLIWMVYTNDIHQLVFRFPEGKPYSDTAYTYGPGYFCIVVWCVILSISFIGMLLFKCRAPGKKWFQKMPLVVLGVAILFSILYCTQLIRADLTVVDCFIILLLLESCIRSGLIRSNSGYARLFRSALLEAQISDTKGKVCYISSQARHMDEKARTLMDDPANQGMIFNGKRLNCSDITNGRVFWWEDVTEILQYTKQLEEMQQKLSEQNDLLKAELTLRENQMKVNEQNRLYDRITSEIAPQLNQLEQLLKDDQAAGKKRIARICVLCAYIKRRSNLCLLSENGEFLQWKELEFCISESLESMRLCGFICSFNSACTGRAKNSIVILLYDLIQEIFQQLLPDKTGALLVTLNASEDNCLLKLQTDMPVKTGLLQLQALSEAGGTFSMESSFDTTWLIFQFRGGK